MRGKIGVRGWKDWSKHFSAVSGRSKAWLKLEAYCVFVGLALTYPLLPIEF